MLPFLYHTFHQTVFILNFYFYSVHRYGTEEVVEEDIDDDNNTVMALGNGRQESAGKDDSYHGDRTREVVNRNNTMMQRPGAGSSRPRAEEWRTDSPNSGIKKL